MHAPVFVAGKALLIYRIDLRRCVHGAPAVDFNGGGFPGYKRIREMKESTTVWKSPVLFWVVLSTMTVLAVYMFREGLGLMVSWWERDEYSHGYLIPLIVLFLDLAEKRRTRTSAFQWVMDWRTGCVARHVFFFFLGELSSIYTIIQYGFLIALYGIVLAIIGWKAFRMIWVPLLILVFMVPLPTFLYNNLSSQLQLISSQIGVWIIRLFDISVYLEGNVIDLGSYKLQVVEACSGLRYLFPLMTLGFIAAYFFKGAFWKRALIFLSSIPITILMNSFRIGAIGVMVEYWGQSMAEGFLHDFEGWAVFMACTAILILEMWVLAHIGKDRKSLQEAFGLEFPNPTPEGAEVISRNVPPQAYVVTGILVRRIIHGNTSCRAVRDYSRASDHFQAFPCKSVNGRENLIKWSKFISIP